MWPREWNFDIHAYFSKIEEGYYEKLSFIYVAIEKNYNKLLHTYYFLLFLQFFIIFHLILEK